MEKLNLVQSRKFGENISMAFDFIKQNFGNTKKLIIYLVVLAAVSGVAMFMPEIGIYVAPVLSIVASVLILTYVVTYMNLYVGSSDGKVTEEDAMSVTMGNIGGVFWAGFLFFVAVVIGIIFLVIPGIFLSVACGFFGFCVVNYRLGAVDSLKKSYELTKNNWWVTFGYLFVVGLVLGILSAIISWTLTAALVFLGTVGIVLATFVSYTISFIVSILSYFALGVHFYNLVDKKESVDINVQIDSLGTKS